MKPNKRIVLPEILDHLQADDPRAVRSRRDLRLINLLMGNHHWLLKQVKELRERGITKIVEIGSGDGLFCNKLGEEGFSVQAIDLAPEPKELHENVIWRQGDIFELLGEIKGDVIIANLFLHHFKEDELKKLGELFHHYSYFLCCEPLRWSTAHVFGKILHPVINDVTRHDMHVSIDAGFVEGELCELLGLEESFEISESSSWQGGARVLASKNER